MPCLLHLFLGFLEKTKISWNTLLYPRLKLEKKMAFIPDLSLHGKLFGKIRRGLYGFPYKTAFPIYKGHLPTAQASPDLAAEFFCIVRRLEYYK